MPFVHCTVISCKRRSFSSLACMEGASNRFYWLGDQLKHLALIQMIWTCTEQRGIIDFCVWSMVALNDQQICFMVFMTVRVLNSTGPANYSRSLGEFNNAWNLSQERTSTFVTELFFSYKLLRNWTCHLKRDHPKRKCHFQNHQCLRWLNFSLNSPILRWLNFKVFVGCAFQAKASALLQIQAPSLSDEFAKLTPFDTVVSDRSWGPHPLQK